MMSVVSVPLLRTAHIDKCFRSGELTRTKEVYCDGMVQCVDGLRRGKKRLV